VGIRESSVEFNGFDRSSFGPWASPQAELHDTYSDSIKRPPCLNTPVRYSAHPPELAENTTPLFLANEAYLRGVHELHGLTAETTETLKGESLVTGTLLERNKS
jgi:hypothetical protein